MRTIFLTMVAFFLMTGAAYAETIKVSVTGLVCSFCATGIEKTFKKEPQVDNIKVDLDKKLVTIDTKPSQTLDDKKVTKLINDAGYSVTNITREK